MIEASQDELELNLMTGCVAACLAENRTEKKLAKCYEDCLHANSTQRKFSESNGNQR